MKRLLKQRASSKTPIYQTEVVETIFDKHGYLIWTRYNPDQEDAEAPDGMDLIFQAPNGEFKIMNDTEQNREYYMHLVDVQYGTEIAYKGYEWED